MYPIHGLSFDPLGFNRVMVYPRFEWRTPLTFQRNKQFNAAVRIHCFASFQPIAVQKMQMHLDPRFNTWSLIRGFVKLSYRTWGFSEPREHEICLTKKYEQWRAVTHGRYLHTQYYRIHPFLFLRQMSNKCFISFYPNPHRVAMLCIRFPPSSYSMFPYISISVLTIGP